jgi:hypothetical protein
MSRLIRCSSEVDYATSKNRTIRISHSMRHGQGFYQRFLSESIRHPALHPKNDVTSNRAAPLLAVRIVEGNRTHRACYRPSRLSELDLL